MKYFLSILFIFSLNLVSPLLAQDKSSVDMSALLENKIWKVQLPQDKQYAIEMEFRSAEWKQSFLYDKKQTPICYSYSLHEDTIKVFESGKDYIIQELTDSTLVLQYLPEILTIEVAPVRCTTDNSIQGQRQNEERLDSIWRKEDIWNKGVAKITGEPIKDLSTIEPPRWAIWNYDLEKYFVSRMKYPKKLLEKNVAGYSVVMFSLDTLGLPRGINILTSIHKDFDKEVIRLTQELPHCLPCRDKNGKRMECFYTVYVPFLPQHYKDRVKTDSVREEELKQCLVEWESGSYFQKGNPYAITNYINEHLRYNPKMLGNKNQIRGIYTIQIDSYGEVSEAKTMRSCGIPELDSMVLQIMKGMPRWTPAINYWKGEYQNSVWTVPVLFKNDTSVLIRYGATLTAHTTEPYLEVGVPVCYLNERGDTIVPYGKYRYCQTDTIKELGFVYENKPKDARIICINNTGKELFYVFKYDNGPDYIQEGLFRIMDENGLIGFADSLGNVIIRPQFKFAYPFKGGKTKVTLEGEQKEVPKSEGEKHYWESGTWFYVDKRNKHLTD